MALVQGVLPLSRWVVLALYGSWNKTKNIKKTEAHLYSFAKVECVNLAACLKILEGKLLNVASKFVNFYYNCLLFIRSFKNILYLNWQTFMEIKFTERQGNLNIVTVES